MELKERGKVKWFNKTKGFGFIARECGTDIFVHYSGIKGEGHRNLDDGQPVEYTIIETERGVQAEDVVPV